MVKIFSKKKESLHSPSKKVVFYIVPIVITIYKDKLNVKWLTTVTDEEFNEIIKNRFSTLNN